MLAAWANDEVRFEGRLVLVGEEPQLELPDHDAFQFFTDQEVEHSSDWQQLSHYWQQAVRDMVSHIRSLTQDMVAIDIRTGFGPNRYDVIFDMAGAGARPLDAFMREIVAIFSKVMETDIEIVPVKAE